MIPILHIIITEETSIAQIFLQLRDNEVTHIMIEYAGCGDSGSIDTITGLRKGAITETEEGHMILDKELESELIINFEKELTTSIEKIAYDMLLDNKVSDWCNNEGGQGTLYISTADGRYYCDHSYNVQESISEIYEGTFLNLE